jgi:aryl-alcohol dehydrogenase-like predicted oxidoreductase
MTVAGHRWQRDSGRRYGRTMRHRFLGRSGLKVSELCLGAMTFGRETDPTTSHRMLDTFVDAGGTFVDTADVYGQGTSEEILGQWLAKGPRERVVVATKVRFPMGDGPNDQGLSRGHIVRSVENSLRRLQTDHIDLYQVHAWDGATALEETLSTLDRLVQDGKVRYLGASNYAGYQLQKAVDTSAAHGWEGFVSLQALYNLLDRELEWELVPVSRNEGLGILPWSPLRGGWLTGRYRRDMAGPPEGTRLDEAAKQGWGEAWDVYANEHTWGVVDVLDAVAEETGRTQAQVALAWVLGRPGVTAPILGARTMAHLEANLGAVGWELSEDQRARLDAASAKPLPYPYATVTADAERT